MKPSHKVPIQKLLVLPVGDVVFFPGCVTFLVLNKSGFRQRTVEKAMASDRLLLVVSDRSDAGRDPATKEIARIGTISRIADVETLPDGSSRLRLHGLRRGKILRLGQSDGIFEGRIQAIEQRRHKLSSVAEDTLNYAMDLFFDKYTDYCHAAGLPCPNMLLSVADPKGNHETWCDVIAGNLGSAIAQAKRQELLETLNPVRRIRLLGKTLKERVKEFASDPELEKRLDARRREAQEQAIQAKREHEERIAVKFEKLKKEVVKILAQPAPQPKGSALEVAQFPMVPIRDTVVLPFNQMPFVVGREFSLAALNQALATDKRIFLVCQHDAKAANPSANEIYRIGTIARVEQTLNLPDNNVKVLVEGIHTGAARKIGMIQGYFRAKVEFASDPENVSPQTISALKDTWELVRDHGLSDADQQKLLESYHSGGPLECIRQAMDMIMAARKSRS